MCAIKLQEDLQNCIINLNNRVRVTDLLEQYGITHIEVNNVLNQYMEKQESKNNIKYDKQFVVYGEQREVNYIRKIFKIVGEQKLCEWLSKLEKSTKTLYSIQIRGGAKPPAEIFVPLSINKDVVLRQVPETMVPNTEIEDVNIAVANNPARSTEALKSESITAQIPSTSSSSNKIKKPSPQLKKSPTASDLKQQKSAIKSGINKYFITGTKNIEEKSVTKKLSPYDERIKQPSKQNEKIINQVNSNNQKNKLNMSVPLFEDEMSNENEDVECISSDEDEKIEALKRDIISSDVEIEENEEITIPKKQSNKRRRIEDDDDNDMEKEYTSQLPPEKIEKLENHAENIEQKSHRMAYLDEDDFVVTIRSTSSKLNLSKSKVATSNITSPKKREVSKSPISRKKKSSPNASKKSTTPKKIKQANLTSYFKKK